MQLTLTIALKVSRRSWVAVRPPTPASVLTPGRSDGAQAVPQRASGRSQGQVRRSVTYSVVWWLAESLSHLECADTSAEMNQTRSRHQIGRLNLSHRCPFHLSWAGECGRSGGFQPTEPVLSPTVPNQRSVRRSSTIYGPFVDALIAPLAQNAGTYHNRRPAERSLSMPNRRGVLYAVIKPSSWQAGRRLYQLGLEVGGTPLVLPSQSPILQASGRR